MKELIKYAWEDDRVKFTVCFETGLLIACYFGTKNFPIPVPYFNTFTAFLGANLIGGALAVREIASRY